MRSIARESLHVHGSNHIREITITLQKMRRCAFALLFASPPDSHWSMGPHWNTTANMFYHVTSPVFLKCRTPSGENGVEFIAVNPTNYDYG